MKYATIEDDAPISTELSWQEVRSMMSSLEVTNAFHPENYGYNVVRVTLGIYIKL